MELAPPESDEEPLQGDKNQEPAAGGPAGFSTSTGRKDAGSRADATAWRSSTCRGIAAGGTLAGTRLGRPAAHRPAPGARPPAGKPDLRNVVPEDLRDTGRLLELYEQAVGLGLVTASEWGRLRFVAAAEHARIIGTKNPCGLFVRLVRGGLWHFATYDDETAASVRLRRHLHGVIARRAEQAPGLAAGPAAVGRRPAGAGVARGGGPLGASGRSVPAAEA